MTTHDVGGCQYGGQVAVIEQRASFGKALRREVPRESHANFAPAPDRDPLAVLRAQDAIRVADLLPVRYGRMAVSPFAFYRGAARVMAADLAPTPTSGLRTQLCGDAHLSNFGAYASPERRLVFDINDFDETLPGPFEWDVKRLAASFAVVGRDNGLSSKQCRQVARSVVSHYRMAMREFAAQPILDVWYARLDIERVVTDYLGSLTKRARKRVTTALDATVPSLRNARSRTSLQAIRKLTTSTPGGRRIAEDPPLVVPLSNVAGIDANASRGMLMNLVADYRSTLQSDRRHLLDHFTLTDIAHKVVGVGSVGLRAWILLFESGVESGGLLLQAKQALPSVLAEHVGTDNAGPQGQRVVAGQRVMQASSDIFLGWLSIDTPDGRREDYYIRQLRDWKVSAEVERMTATSLRAYARMCGWTLARAHARAGDRVEIAAYLGASAAFDEAVAEFATAYADQNERDHDALLAAIRAGDIEIADEKASTRGKRRDDREQSDGA